MGTFWRREKVPKKQPLSEEDLQRKIHNSIPHFHFP
jgi:hypothetical protein